MDNKTLVLDALRQIGRERATAVKTAAVAGSMTDTEIIDAEGFIPDWKAKDYTGEAMGTPVRYGEQVYGLLQPHNATGQTGWDPATAPALWSLKHTKNPVVAKPYVAPLGTSGLYQQDECAVWTDGKTYRSTIANNAYTPETYPAGWKVYGA